MSALAERVAELVAMGERLQERALELGSDGRSQLKLIRGVVEALAADRVDDARGLLAAWLREPSVGIIKAGYEQAVLDAMTAFTDDDLRASVKASRGCPPDYPQYRETQLSLGVCAAELRRRGLEAVKTDFEVFEAAKQQALAFTRRVAAAQDESGGFSTDEEFLSACGPQAYKVVAADDIREIGRFDLGADGERVVRCWVYRERGDSEIVYVLGWKKRMELQQRGAAQLLATVVDDRDQN